MTQNREGHCTVIAEAGVNHNGKLDFALQLIDAAIDGKADIVKFQTFQANLLATPTAPKAEYQKKLTNSNSSQLEMLGDLELSKEDWRKIFKHAKTKKIRCISTPFDIPSLQMLLTLGMDIIKIPSGEVTNGPFLLELAKTGLPVILSTGMSTLDEIAHALAVLSFGYLNPQKNPSSLKECLNYLKDSPRANKRIKEKVTLLHCTTNYPADYEEINLNAMITMQNHFDIPTGYSDHSLGILVPIVAASLGAVIIEKHITLDKTLPGPDHSASLEPEELKLMVENIRNVSIIKGHRTKKPTFNELKNRLVARRGIYAAEKIESGEFFNKNNLAILRPEGNSSPMQYWELLGKKSKRNYSKNSAI